MRTLYHEFVSLRRKPTASATDELPELLQPDADPTAPIDLARAVNTLKPAERAVIVARYVEDLPVADVATAMGRTQGWVKVTASRALKKLTPTRGQVVLDGQPVSRRSNRHRSLMRAERIGFVFQDAALSAATDGSRTVVIAIHNPFVLEHADEVLAL